MFAHPGHLSDDIAVENVLNCSPIIPPPCPYKSPTLSASFFSLRGTVHLPLHSQVSINALATPSRCPLPKPEPFLSPLLIAYNAIAIPTLANQRTPSTTASLQTDLALSSYDIHTAYYGASIPLWRDQLPDLSRDAIDKWKAEWIESEEAGEVVSVVGAWIVVFRSPRDKAELVRFSTSN